MVPFNLCGTGVELMRSCSFTEMEFFDPPGLRVPVRWYFCDEDAKVLPFSTRFGSGNWASARDLWPGPGECLDANRGWSNGEPPGPNPVNDASVVFLGGFFDTANSLTPDNPFGYNPDTTILVIVAYRVTGGGGQITSVTDNRGRLYFKDFSARSANDSTVGIDVWRTSNDTLQPSMTLPTIHFPGSSMKPTIWFHQVRGLLKQEPISEGHKSGTIGAKPNVESIETEHLNQYLLGVVSCADIAAITTYPTGFTSMGFLPTNPLVEGANAVFKCIDHKQSMKLRWNATIAGPWLAVGLVYQGKTKEVPPGKKYCGTADMLTNGPTPAMKKVCANESGYAACCYDFLEHLNCCNFQLATGLSNTTFEGRIIGVHDQEPESIVAAGLPLHFEGSGPGGFQAWIQWHAGDPPASTLIDFGCYLGLPYMVNVNTVNDEGELLFSEDPFGMAVWGVRRSMFSEERWDVLVNTMPPPRPIPPPTAAIFPEGFWPFEFFPPYYL